MGNPTLKVSSEMTPAKRLLIAENDMFDVMTPLLSKLELAVGYTEYYGDGNDCDEIACVNLVLCEINNDLKTFYQAHGEKLKEIRTMLKSEKE